MRYETATTITTAAAAASLHLTHLAFNAMLYVSSMRCGVLVSRCYVLCAMALVTLVLLILCLFALSAEELRALGTCTMLLTTLMMVTPLTVTPFTVTPFTVTLSQYLLPVRCIIASASYHIVNPRLRCMASVLRTLPSSKS